VVVTKHFYSDWTSDVETGVGSVLELIHPVVVGDVAEISEVHAASIFRVEVQTSMYFRNIGIIAHNHTVLQSKNRININNELLWKPKISNKWRLMGQS
jgi:hypothetical protein